MGQKKARIALNAAAKTMLDSLVVLYAWIAALVSANNTIKKLAIEKAKA